jgi:hypothetical protein
MLEQDKSGPTEKNVFRTDQGTGRVEIPEFDECQIKKERITMREIERLKNSED